MIRRWTLPFIFELGNRRVWTPQHALVAQTAGGWDACLCGVSKTISSVNLFSTIQHDEAGQQIFKGLFCHLVDPDSWCYTVLRLFPVIHESGAEGIFTAIIRSASGFQVVNEVLINLIQVLKWRGSSEMRFHCCNSFHKVRWQLVRCMCAMINLKLHQCFQLRQLLKVSQGYIYFYIWS